MSEQIDIAVDLGVVPPPLPEMPRQRFTEVRDRANSL
jgi:hypothetical protein